MDKVAVIILNYNGKHFLEKFLPDIIRYNDGYPVYVADNHSTDQSVEFLESNYPEEVIIIKLEDNFGFSGGYNKAVINIDAEYYVFLNSDIEVTEGWIRPLLSLLESNTKIAACQPKLLDFNEKNRFEYAGAAGGYIDLLGYPFCRGRVFQTYEKDYGQYDDIVPIFWASGACMMIRSKVFKDLGGFDDDYFAHMEEIDLCWRIKRSGLEVYYNSESAIYHVGGGTLHESNPFKTYLNFRNSLITLIKNDNPFALLWKVPARLLFDVIASAKFLITNSFRDTFAVIRADFYVIRRLLYYIKKRKKCQNDNNRQLGVYNKSIVISYYFLRRKFFFNLRSIVPDHIISSS